MKHNQVWITGVGTCSPLGHDYPTFANRILAGYSGIRTIPYFDPKDHVCKIAGVMDPLTAPKGFDDAEFQKLRDWEQVMLYCAANALQDGGLWENRQSLRIGLVMGVGGEWIVTWEGAFHRGSDQVMEPESDGPGLVKNLHTQLGIQGPWNTVAAACASGNVALAFAREWVRRGWVDVCLAGAGDRSLTPMGLACFGNLGALSKRNDEPTRASRPFDKNRDGFVMGEGGAVFLLESAERAKKRHSKVYAEILGFGASSDAFHMVMPSPNADYAAQAMTLAMKDAKLNPEDIDYINAHATSTPVGDPFETRGIKIAMGSALPKIPVSGTKSMTGHLIGAAASIEALACIAAFDRQAVPPTINLENPDPECDLCHVPNEAQERTLKIAISNSFGFGGSNTALILKKVG